MELQVLVATLNNNNIRKLVEKMNINTNAIICNQTDKVKYEEFSIKDNIIKVYSFNEKGVGLNRNNALMRATGDIVLISDDDIKYKDGYEQIILKEFEKNPKADMIVFNMINNDIEHSRYIIKKFRRVHRYNCLRYGAVRIAFRLEKLREKNVFFSLLFGGGARYSCGEDSLFILECIRKCVKVYSSPKYIGTINSSQSTWFTGYHEKFFHDKAKFFELAYGKFAFIMSLQLLIRHRKIFCTEIKFIDALKIMKKALKKNKEIKT